MQIDAAPAEYSESHGESPARPVGSMLRPSNCRDGSKNRLQRFQPQSNDWRDPPPGSAHKPEPRKQSRRCRTSRPDPKLATAPTASQGPGPGSAPLRSPSPPLGIAAASTADPAPKRGGFTPAAPLSALAVAPAGVRAAPPTPAAPESQITDGVMQRGHTLSQMLRADGVSPQTINQIAQALKGHFNFRRAKPGQSYRLVQDRAGNVQEFRYHVSPTQSFTLKRVDGELRVSSEDGRARAALHADRRRDHLHAVPVDHQPRRGRIARARLRRHLRLGRRLPAQGPPGRQLPDPLRAAVPRGRRPRDLRAPGPDPRRALPEPERRVHGRLLRVARRQRRLLPARRILGRGRVPDGAAAPRADHLELQLRAPPSHPQDHAAASRDRLRGLDRHAGLVGRRRRRDLAQLDGRQRESRQDPARERLRLLVRAPLALCRRPARGRPGRAEAGDRLRGPDRARDRPARLLPDPAQRQVRGPGPAADARGRADRQGAGAGLPRHARRAASPSSRVSAGSRTGNKPSDPRPGARCGWHPFLPAGICASIPSCANPPHRARLGAPA